MQFGQFVGDRTPLISLLHKLIGVFRKPRLKIGIAQQL